MDVPSDSKDSIIMPNLCSFTFLLVYSFTTNNGTLKHVIQVVLLFFRYFTIFQWNVETKNSCSFFGAPVSFKQKVPGEERVISTRNHPVCRFFSLSVILSVCLCLSLQKLNRKLVIKRLLGFIKLSW